MICILFPEYLLSKGAKIDFETKHGLCIAISNGQLEVVKFLIEKASGSTPPKKNNNGSMIIIVERKTPTK